MYHMGESQLHVTASLHTFTRIALVTTDMALIHSPIVELFTAKGMSAMRLLGTWPISSRSTLSKYTSFSSKDSSRLTNRLELSYF